MNISDETHAKANAIERSALEDGCTNPERMASYSLSLACALLTSTSKDEREKGKQMVRRWKNGNSF